MMLLMRIRVAVLSLRAAASPPTRNVGRRDEWSVPGPQLRQALADSDVLALEIDPAEVMRAKFDFDVTGHYARPDVFELTVDTRAKTAVREV